MPFWMRILATYSGLTVGLVLIARTMKANGYAVQSNPSWTLVETLRNACLSGWAALLGGAGIVAGIVCLISLLDRYWPSSRKMSVPAEPQLPQVEIEKQAEQNRLRAIEREKARDAEIETERRRREEEKREIESRRRLIEERRKKRTAKDAGNAALGDFL